MPHPIRTTHDPLERMSVIGLIGATDWPCTATERQDKHVCWATSTVTTSAIHGGKVSESPPHNTPQVSTRSRLAA